MSFVSVVKLWIGLSVFATGAGWLLSLFGWLSVAGYLTLGGITLLGYLVLRQCGAFPADPYRWHWQKFRRRFMRPFPLLFALLAVLAFVGGLLYAPTNHTGLSYRIARVLNWIEAGQWHWIYTPNYRMNNRACGIEWLSAPLLLFLKSDRGLFLLNFIPYALMPGLLFSLLTRLGIRARAAWGWMWLLPTGYVFLLQAGSAGNDAFPVVYAMAAIDFACRAWISRRPSDVWYSLLAAALLTGAKASNLPLGLMWIILVAPLWRILKPAPLGTSLVFLLALVVSFLPTALLNLKYCGSWSGLNLENTGMEMKDPVVGVWGNGLLILGNNLCPPLFPMAGWWNQHWQELLPGFITRPMVANFEGNFHLLWELPHEDWTGIGMGVTVLLLISARWALPHFFRSDPSLWRRTSLPPLILKLALLAPWIALVAYGTKSGMVTPARLIAPYYPLLLPALLIGPEQSALVRARWWRILAGLAFLMAFAVLILTPPRPLWPAQTILRQVVAWRPESQLLNRALTTYTTYSTRNDPHASLRAKLPAHIRTIGFLGTADDLDISFWRPFGTRRVARIALEETAAQIRQRNIEYAVVSGLHFELLNQSLDDWLTQTRAEIVATDTLAVSVQTGPRPWYVVRFKE
jgi:hypothetical protein